jgi:hypothetical protein
MPRCRQNGAYQRSGVVNRRLRSPLAHDEGNLPSPEPVKKAILASKSPGIWRMSGKWFSRHKKLTKGGGTRAFALATRLLPREPQYVFRQ